MEKEEKKRHKLILIAPSGKEYKLGFLSPCKNGIVIGTAEVEEGDTSHLTVLFNEDSISSHNNSSRWSGETTIFSPTKYERNSK